MVLRRFYDHEGKAYFKDVSEEPEVIEEPEVVEEEKPKKKPSRKKPSKK